MQLDSLGEVISMRLEEGVSGDAFPVADKEGNAQPIILESYRSLRQLRPHRYVDLLSKPAIAPIGPLEIYTMRITQWGK